MRNAAAEAQLREGKSWSTIITTTGCSRATLAKVAKRQAKVAKRQPAQG